MKSILILIALAVVLAFAAMVLMGVMSKSGSAPGLVEGKLSPCPQSPNCVCTEYAEDQAHFIEPVSYGNANIKIVRSMIRKAIDSSGGTMAHERDNYFAATYRSSLFGFVDDLEVRIDESQKLIHIRSASRVGHSDMGVNKMRAMELRALLQNI